MIYKPFQDIKLSALAMGAMRLPMLGTAWDSPIDEGPATEMIDCAMARGINYYDTAWGYHGGQSEVVLGRALAKYPRGQWYIADKFPGYDMANMGKAETIFEEQLRRCGVEYFDFYLFHNVYEMNIDAYLDEKYGILKYLLKQKENGRIRHLGFSVHGRLNVMKRFLEAYGTHMEFCQIQLNYQDWAFQKAKAKVELLNEYHIPVWAMEPMRGGQLASLPQGEAAKLKLLRPEETIPAWALRFLQSIEGVTLVLSGASTLTQLQENIEVFREEKPLNEEEKGVLFSIAESIMQKAAIPCTACQYCAGHCPQRLDIPMLLSLYNEYRAAENGLATGMKVSAMPEEKRPGACIACKNCEAVCPQQIKISQKLADFAAALHGD